MLIYKIDIAFDKDAGKFYVDRSDIVGLHAEASSLQEIADVIRDVAPDLIEANHMPVLTTIAAFFRGVLSPASSRQVVAGGINLRLSHDVCTAQ